METAAASLDAAQQQEAIALKKALEWELSLDSRDLRSHAWYHGPISRQRAEELVAKDGDFLIRDCTSQPGNYVVTCRNKGTPLHFVIRKLVLQPDTVYERFQYQLEDDSYDTIADLITFYVGSGHPISAASGARISSPCTRTYPLSYYSAKYSGGGSSGGSIRGPSPLQSPSPLNTPGYRSPFSQQPITYRSPMSSPPRTRREIPPRLPSKKQRSQSLTPLQPGQHSRPPHERYCSADGVIQGHPVPDGMEKCGSTDAVSPKAEEQGRSTPNGRQSLPRATSAQAFRNLRLHSRTSSLTRDYSDTSLSPCMEQRHGIDAPSPPPKPSRNSSLTRHSEDKENRKQRDPSYRTSGSDSGNGSGDSAQSSATGEETAPPRSGVIIRHPRYLTPSCSSQTLRSFGDFDPVASEHQLLQMTQSVIEVRPTYDLDTFQTVLLPFTENKPLDSETLHTIQMMLHENGSRIIATHLTRVDIKLILGLDSPPISQYASASSPTAPAGSKTPTTPTAATHDQMTFNHTGIELITLEHGQVFRQALIERTECLKLLVATTVLTCTSDLDRAETINKWIQVAIDTKTALGNLFGFCAIMLGLCMPQLEHLTSTWHTLRQKYTDSAFTFEAKLRPVLKSMNDCTNPQAPNTTIPHLLPYILLRDRDLGDVLGQSSAMNATPSLLASCVNAWENIAEDFGLSIFWSHLDSARSFVQNLSLYKKNAQIILADTSRIDPLLEEVFRTEFHMKFLWGSRGATVPALDRHAKFEAVIKAMAEKFCNNDKLIQQNDGIKATGGG